MTKTAAICATAFASVSALILVMAVVVTQAISAGASPRLRLPFRLLCHGIETRALRISAVPMPICSRCTGIYAGAIVGTGVFLIPAILARRRARRGLQSADMVGFHPDRGERPALIPDGAGWRVEWRRVDVVALALTMPLVVDGLTQATGLRESTNALRLTTGVVAAAAVLFAVLQRIDQSARRRGEG